MMSMSFSVIFNATVISILFSCYYHLLSSQFHSTCHRYQCFLMSSSSPVITIPFNSSSLSMIFNVIFCHLQCHSQFQCFSTLLSFPVITVPSNSSSPKCHHCSIQPVVIKVVNVSNFIKAKTSHYKFFQLVIHMEKTLPDLSVMSYFKEQQSPQAWKPFNYLKDVLRILEREHICRQSLPLDLICTKSSTLTLNWLRHFLASHKRKLG